MNRYIVEKRLGEGAFGLVFLAIHKDSGRRVAIKRMRRSFSSWEECLKLREVQILQNVRHPGIVELLEVFREKERLHLVFEYVGQNLYQLLSQRNGIPLPERTIRSWIKQALTALAAIHAAGYVHRDVKPENLLVNKESTLKIADFGLARSITPNPEIQNNTLLTDYVSTRWYRAPEVLLPGCSESGQYGTAIDLYALGTVAAELYTSYPLLPGTSEADQLHCICAVFGPPTEETWAEGLRRAEGCGFTFHKLYTEGGSGRIERLSLLIPTASQHALALIASLCQWDPAKRPTALEALQHPYFQEGREWDLQESVLNPLIAAKVNRWLEAAAQKLADHNNPNVSKHVPRPSIGKLVSRAIRRQVNTLNAYHERRQRLPVL